MQVVKVGGSLLDLPDLGVRLGAFLEPRFPAVVVAGGGKTADCVREMDSIHRLGEEKSHWLALRAAAVNAHLLADILPRAAVCNEFQLLRNILYVHKFPILDPYRFCREEEEFRRNASGGPRPELPHSWTVTTDSVAARVANHYRATLYLLKSTPLPPATGLDDAARLGLVDPYFPIEARSLEVIYVNLRAEPPQLSVLHRRGAAISDDAPPER